VRQLRQGVRQAAGADVVDREDRVVLSLQLPAAVDDFLARRWISGLPRCTEAKSRSAVLVPVVIDEAAPPPRPISMPGPPSWMSSAPAANSILCGIAR
jgi:hypothetical protein